MLILQNVLTSSTEVVNEASGTTSSNKCKDSADLVCKDNQERLVLSVFARVPKGLYKDYSSALFSFLQRALSIYEAWQCYSKACIPGLGKLINKILKSFKYLCFVPNALSSLWLELSCSHGQKPVFGQ